MSETRRKNLHESRPTHERIASVFWCAICRQPTRGWRCNPWPVKLKGYACEACDLTVVLPARLEMAKAPAR